MIPAFRTFCSTGKLLSAVLAIVALPAVSAEWAPDVAIGDQLPEVNATDQTGQQWTNERLTADNGLALVFFRSADW